MLLRICLLSSIFITIYILSSPSVVLIPNLMRELPKPIFNQKLVYLKIKFSFLLQRSANILPFWNQLASFQPLGWLQTHKWTFGAHLQPHESTSKAHFQPNKITFKGLNKELYYKKSAKNFIFVEQYSSLQPPEGLQMLIYNPKSVLPKTIFNEIWVLSKVKLSSLFKNQLRSDLFGTKGPPLSIFNPMR